jgi:hypothetical protein
LIILTLVLSQRDRKKTALQSAQMILFGEGKKRMNIRAHREDRERGF